MAYKQWRYYDLEEGQWVDLPPKRMDHNNLFQKCIDEGVPVAIHFSSGKFFCKYNFEALPAGAAPDNMFTAIASLIGKPEISLQQSNPSSKTKKSLKVRLKNQPSHQMLFKMAFYGLDTAYESLATRPDGKKNQTRIRQSRIDHRPRYGDVSASPLQAKKRVVEVPEDLLDIPFKALILPLGKGQFLRDCAGLERSTTTKDVVEMLNRDRDMDAMLNSIADFRTQAIASISFHSQVCARYGSIQFEADVLDYIFRADAEREFVENALKRIHPSIPDIRWEKVDPGNNRYHPVYNLTRDILRHSDRWREGSFQEVSRIADSLPKLLGLTDKVYPISASKYPPKIKKLSVFCIASLTSKKGIREKVKDLHRLGLTNVGDLLLITEPYRTLFVDRDKRRKTIELAD